MTDRIRQDCFDLLKAFKGEMKLDRKVLLAKHKRVHDYFLKHKDDFPQSFFQNYKAGGFYEWYKMLKEGISYKS